MDKELVLVTGGSGFIGAHCIARLLNDGYRVRTTVRSAGREKDVRAMLEVAGCEAGQHLSFVVADLMADAGWADAAEACAYVLHVASPFPQTVPKHEDDLIRPAREGALRVLRAARDAGVRRVVLTSSYAAVGYGHGPEQTSFDENTWTNAQNKEVGAYARSKTLAERAAWDFIAREGRGMELSVVNPVGVFGPVLGADYSTSILLVQRLMDGAIPGCPQLHFGAVDVRDVVDLHLRAMTHEAAAGERFLAVTGDNISMLELARILKRSMGAAAQRVPTRQLPNWLLRVVSWFDPGAKLILPELGKNNNVSNGKARRVLGWTPRSNEEAVLASAQSLLDLGLLKPLAGAR